MIEFWELLDAQKERTGLRHKRGDAIPQGFYHLVVHIWLMCPEGYFLMSQRQKNRPYALKWERTGGSVLYGETSLEGARREVLEELGIDLKNYEAHFIKSQKRERYHDFYDSWMFIIDNNTLFKLQASEVMQARWFSLNELDELKKENRIVKSSRYYKEVYDYFLKVKGKND